MFNPKYRIIVTDTGVYYLQKRFCLLFYLKLGPRQSSLVDAQDYLKSYLSYLDMPKVPNKKVVWEGDENGEEVHWSP